MPAGKTRRFGRYIAIAVGLALCALLIKTCAFPSKPPTRYITAPVKIGDIEQTVLADGVLQPLKLVDVGAQASGQVKSLKVALGDHVAEGQLIAVIDPSTEQNALLNAQAILEQQQAQHRLQAATVAQNQRLYDRQLETYGGDASSKQDLETAETNLETSKASLAAIEAQIKQATLTVDTAGVNLGFTQIHAPISGVVVAVVTKEGQTVNSVQSAPTIVQLAKLDTMTVKAQISEADVIKVHAGMGVYFTILGDQNRRYYATLREVAPAPDAPATPSATPTAVYYSGLFDVANADGRLRPSMTAQVNVVLSSAKHVLIAPAAALGPPAKDGASTVRVLDPKTKKPVVREVRTGVNNLVDVQILSGLKAGDSVIIAESAGAFAAPKPPGAG